MNGPRKASVAAGCVRIAEKAIAASNREAEGYRVQLGIEAGVNAELRKSLDAAFTDVQRIDWLEVHRPSIFGGPEGVRLRWTKDGNHHGAAGDNLRAAVTKAITACP